MESPTFLIDIAKPTISINSSTKCVVEVDLKYPKELRELHNNYPLAPGKRNQKRNII